ncbi:DUF2142 domain-containing protein [Methylobacterium sp. P31]
MAAVSPPTRPAAAWWVWLGREAAAHRGARFWCLAFLGLGLPVCVVLALTAPLGGASHALAGEALGLGSAGAARLGRLANVTAFMALGLAALALACRGQAVLFALLCLPASLAVAHGLDGLLLALAALAAALLTPRPLTGRRRLPRLAGAALAVALIVLAKPAYAPVAGMLLVPPPPPGRLGRFCRDRLPLAGLALLPALLPALLRMPLASGAASGVSPSFFVSLPWPLAALWAVALLVPPVALRRGPLPPPAERLWLAGSALLGLWLVVLSQVLAPPGTGRLDGLQVRDLLPFAPMLVLAFARGRIGTAAALRWPALLPVLAAAVGAVALPLLALCA